LEKQPIPARRALKGARRCERAYKYKKSYKIINYKIYTHKIKNIYIFILYIKQKKNFLKIAS